MSKPSSANPRVYDEFDDPAARYRWCRRGFSLMALALGLQAFSFALSALVSLGDSKSLQDLRTLVRSAEFDWYVGSPLTWGGALAAWLLVGRFRDRAWNRAAVALALMNSLDVLLWLHDHAPALRLNFALPTMDDDWARRAASVLQWFELWFAAWLATRVGVELGRPEAANLNRVARGTTIFGFFTWGFAFATLTGLRFGWVQANRRMVIEMLLAWELSVILLAVTAFQVTALCAMAARACRAYLIALRRAEDSDALLAPKDTDFGAWREDAGADRYL